MEKIKAALHIHDKTPIPNDGAVGNMQNPSSSDSNEPTATDLWGTGNAESVYHANRKADTVAAAATEGVKGSRQSRSQYQSQPPAGAQIGQSDAVSTGTSTAPGTSSKSVEDPDVILTDSATDRQDDAYSRAQKALRHAPSGTSKDHALEERAIAQETVPGSIPEEKVGSSSAEHWTQLEPLNQPEPSAETGPAGHLRADTTTTAASVGGGEAALNQGGHTAYYDAATGRGPHTTQGSGPGN